MKNFYITLSFNLLLILLLSVNLACSVFGIRTVEEISYTTELKDGDKEIREYSSRIVAKTSVTGKYKETQRQAFRILADYIFGNNIKKQKIAMTAPVTQENKSTKIEMTAPVTISQNSQSLSMSFAMPGKYKSTLELPKPKDDRIELLQVPGGLFAVIRYTWLTSEDKNQMKAKELLDWLFEKGKYRAISDVFYASYDPPWTIPFFRRHEMMVKVEQDINNTGDFQ